MNMWAQVTSLLLQALLWRNVYGYLPLWKNLLTHHLDWEGSYVHNETKYDCSLSVSSIGLDEGKVSYVHLTADHIHMDMKVTTDDDVMLLFKEEAVWKKAVSFENHTDIVIEGQFVPDRLYYVFMGNVSSAEEDNFAAMLLRPKGFKVRTHHQRNHTSLRYGLAVGIPLTCAVLLMVTAGMIMWWAIRKGYLRHVPWAYKNFRNPSRNSSVLELRDSGGGGESPSLHI